MPSLMEAGGVPDIQKRINDAEQALAEANADVVHASGLSVRLQKLAAATACSAKDDLQILVDKQAPLEKQNGTFETLDKLRAERHRIWPNGKRGFPVRGSK